MAELSELNMNFLHGLTPEEASSFFGEETVHERIIQHFGTSEAAYGAGVRFLQSLGLAVFIGSTEIGFTRGTKELHNYYYALKGGIHAGYLKVDAEPDSTTAQFDSFDLTPAWQGRGLGKRILTAALADLKNRNFREVRSDSVTTDA